MQIDFLCLSSELFGKRLQVIRNFRSNYNPTITIEVIHVNIFQSSSGLKVLCESFDCISSYNRLSDEKYLKQALE